MDLLAICSAGVLDLKRGGAIVTHSIDSFRHSIK